MAVAAFEHAAVLERAPVTCLENTVAQPLNRETADGDIRVLHGHVDELPADFIAHKKRR